MSLQPGNRKLGYLIWTWSLLAGKTCPGKTPLCSKLCYAKHGHFLLDSVKESMIENKRMADSENFVGWMTEEIRRHFARVVRLHVAGDFYAAEYTAKWLQIVRACPEVTFYGYSRSWREPEIAPVLRRLAREPNVRLWYSCDRQTGEPRGHGVPRAWMMENDSDLPPFPVDLVFRDKRGTVLYRVDHTPVCSYDNGSKVPTTCSECQLCFKKKETKLWKHLAPKQIKGIGAT